jgi:hypothetical protein
VREEGRRWRCEVKNIHVRVTSAANVLGSALADSHMFPRLEQAKRVCENS